MVEPICLVHLVEQDKQSNQMNQIGPSASGLLLAGKSIRG
jgi:hypothetical protein